MTSDPASQELKSLYRQRILEHARNPRNFGRLQDATHVAPGINPLCGDKIHVFLSVAADNTITDAQFEGSGCAISMASASLLTENVINISTDEALQLADTISARLGDGDASTAEEIPIASLRLLDGVREHPARIKCATLAWKTLQAALTEQGTATTE